MILIPLIILILLFSETKTDRNGCKDIDDLLADVWRIGHSKRLWPEQDYALQQFCLNSIENNEKITDFFDDVFPENSHIQILCRLTSIERTRLLMKYCKNKSQRSKVLVLMKAMNKAVKQMEKIRIETLNKLIEISAPDSKSTFQDLILVLQKYEETTYKAIKDKEIQSILKEIMDNNRRLTNYYLQNFKMTKLKKVAENPCPVDGWRPVSLQYAEATAFNRILSDI